MRDSNDDRGKWGNGECAVVEFHFLTNNIYSLFSPKNPNLIFLQFQKNAKKCSLTFKNNRKTKYILNIVKNRLENNFETILNKLNKSPKIFSPMQSYVGMYRM